MNLEPETEAHNPFFQKLIALERSQQEAQGGLQAIVSALHRPEHLMTTLGGLHRAVERLADAQLEAAGTVSRELKRGVDLQAVTLADKARHPWAALFAAVDEEGGFLPGSAIGEFLKEVIGRESVRWLIEGQAPKREVIDPLAFAARAVEIAPKYGLDHAGLKEADYLQFHAAVSHAFPVMRARAQWAQAHSPSTP
jgi:hypothetical protein